MSTWKAGGITLPNGPFMIGAGVCKNPESTRGWLKIAPVVSGSYTAEQRDGNSGQVWYPDSLEEFLETGYGLNAYGMPNMGFAAAAAELKCIESEQPLIVSIAGFSTDDYIAGVKTFVTLQNVAAIELHFGCPNTEHGPPISFEPDVIDTIVNAVMQLGHSVPIWIKLSPYSNTKELEKVAHVLNKFVCKDTFQIAVVTSNTFPSAFVDERAVTALGGLAGLSGPALKPIALGQVKQLRKHLDHTIDVIGVGGITTGNDVVDFLEAGATAVQTTSLAHAAGHPNTFNNHFFDEGAANRLFELLETN